VLHIIQATYEKEPESAKATPELVSHVRRRGPGGTSVETDRGGVPSAECRYYYCIPIHERLGLTALQLQANLFDTPYAHALLAIRGQPPETYADTASSTAPDAPSSQEEAAEQDPLGLALYFFNFSTWTGRPGIYVRPVYLVWFE
jgi:hypothetical protein